MEKEEIEKEKKRAELYEKRILARKEIRREEGILRNQRISKCIQKTIPVDDENEILENSFGNKENIDWENNVNSQSFGPKVGVSDNWRTQKEIDNKNLNFTTENQKSQIFHSNQINEKEETKNSCPENHLQQQQTNIHNSQHPHRSTLNNIKEMSQEYDESIPSSSNISSMSGQIDEEILKKYIYTDLVKNQIDHCHEENSDEGRLAG